MYLSSTTTSFSSFLLGEGEAVGFVVVGLGEATGLGVGFSSTTSATSTSLSDFFFISNFSFTVSFC